LSLKPLELSHLYLKDTSYLKHMNKLVTPD
jgi:hypothetical protein